MNLTDASEIEIIKHLRAFRAIQRPGELVIRFDTEGNPVKAEPRPVYRLGEKSATGS